MVTGVTIYLFAETCGCDGGVVIDKVHVPSHREEIDWYSVHLDAPMKKEVNRPEQFVLIVQSNGQSSQCDVEREVFETVQVDQYFQRSGSL